MSQRTSSSAPSWLTEDTVSVAAAVAKNPQVQAAAASAAKDPVVQDAVKKEAMKNAPGWTTTADSTPAVPSSADIEANTPPTDDLTLDEETLKTMGKWHLALRALYILAAIIMAVVAGFSLDNQKDLGRAFFAIYVIFFCTLICCFETALSTVARILAINFGFMYTLGGRFTFVVFLCFMSYTLDTTWGLVAMCIMLAVLLYHIFIMWKFPKFETYLRRKHYYEGKREQEIEAKEARNRK